MTKLDIDAIKHLDAGRVMAGLNLELRRAIDDVLNRPGDKSARKVTLQIEIAPKSLTDDNELDEVSVISKCRAVCPPRQSSGDIFQVDGNDLVFNPRSPDNPKQNTLPFKSEGVGV